MKVRMIRVALAAAVVAALAAGWLARPAGAQGVLLRLVADTKNFDTTETATTATVATDGDLVYTRSVFVPTGINTLYVTISTTGDTHNGASIWLSCRLDGAYCNGGAGGAAGAPGGWVSLQKHKNWIGLSGALSGDGGGGGGDVHDNSLTYTWCTQVKPGSHTVDIKMATSGPDFETGDPDSASTVFFEAAHFYIDANRASNTGCPAPTPVG
jgi:hypothetical protein